MRQVLITATETAIRAVNAARFYRTERGFQGRFYCALQAELDRSDLLVAGAILEMEYQKGVAHSMGQRPDIIFHTPSRALWHRPKSKQFRILGTQTQSNRCLCP